MMRDILDVLSNQYGITVTSYQQLESFADSNFHVITERNTSNPHVTGICELGYIVKVINEEDSLLNRPCIEAQLELMLMVSKAGLSVPKPIQTINGYLSHLVSMATKTESRLLMLLEFIPGETLAKINISKYPELLTELGSTAGKLNKAMKNYAHTPKIRRDGLWSLTQLPSLESHLTVIKDHEAREIARKIINQFKDKVLDRTELLQKGIIHHDLNPFNILVEAREGRHKICGILDFLSSTYSFYIFEIAILIAHTSTTWDSCDYLPTKELLLKGYCQEIHLSKTEVKVLDICVMARILQCSIMAERELLSHPNNDYILRFVNWDKLIEIWNLK